MSDPPRAGSPLSPALERLIRLLAEAYVDQLDEADNAPNAIVEAEEESRDV